MIYAIAYPGQGYWNVTRYPYGGEFGRIPRTGETRVAIIAGHVPHPDRESRVKLPNGDIAIIQSSALTCDLLIAPV